MAEELGVTISHRWLTWAKFAIVPGVVGLLATPAILYWVFPPETKETPEAPAMAAEKLKAMGPVTKNEWVMIGTMLIAVSLWIAGYVSLLAIS